MSTLAALTPNTTTPTQEIKLAGTGFLSGAVVVYTSSVHTSTDSAPTVIDSEEIRSIVPDVLQGEAGIVQVSVQNPAEAESNQVPLFIGAWPPVDEVFPLCSISQVKQAMGVSPQETVDDIKYTEAIRHASAQLIGETKFTFDLELHTETYDGDGSTILRLKRFPILDVLALAIDGESIDVQELSQPLDDIIAFDSSEEGEYHPRLRTSAGRTFPSGRANIVVTYSAGYSKVPSWLNVAAISQVSFLLNTINKQGVVNEGNNTMGVQTSFAQLPLCPEARRAVIRHMPQKVAIV